MDAWNHSGIFGHKELTIAYLETLMGYELFNWINSTSNSENKKLYE